MKKLFFLFAFALIIFSCSDSSSGGSSNYYETDDVVEDYEDEESELEWDTDEQELEETHFHNSHSERYVVCPMCNGTGVFEFIPGDVMAPRQTCAGCNGSGRCTEEQAANLRNMQQQAYDAVYGGGNSLPPGGSTSPSGRSAYEIQMDLDKAYRLLDDMERQYQECTSYTVAAQYPSMIADQRERIRRLEEELQSAY